MKEVAPYRFAACTHHRAGQLFTVIAARAAMTAAASHELVPAAHNAAAATTTQQAGEGRAHAHPAFHLTANTARMLSSFAKPASALTHSTPHHSSHALRHTTTSHSSPHRLLLSCSPVSCRLLLPSLLLSLIFLVIRISPQPASHALPSAHLIPSHPIHLPHPLQMQRSASSSASVSVLLVLLLVCCCSVVTVSGNGDDKPSSSSTAGASSSSSAWGKDKPCSSSSTGKPAGYSDPYFVGFWNQPYYVHGHDGEVYSLLSDQHVQLSSRFVFLSNITCPELYGAPARVHCSSHAGTFFGEFGLTTASGDVLYVGAGNSSVGFHIVTVNGLEIDIGQSYGPPPLPAIPHDEHTSNALAATTGSSDHPARLDIYVERTSARSLIVHAGLYELLIENSDRYVDLVQVDVVDWTELLDHVLPSGLMGSSCNNSATMPPNEEEHRERDGALTGCNIAEGKFLCSVAAAKQSQLPEEQSAEQ